MSRYEVKFTKKGLKYFSKLSTSDTKKIISKLALLRDFNQSSSNIKQMKGAISVCYRWRVGNIRVLFEVDRTNNIIWIINVGYRGSVYSQ